MVCLRDVNIHELQFLKLNINVTKILSLHKKSAMLTIFQRSYADPINDLEPRTKNKRSFQL